MTDRKPAVSNPDDRFLRGAGSQVENLLRDLPRARQALLLAPDVVAKDILHCEEDIALILVPAKELDEQVSVLDRPSVDSSHMIMA